MSKSRLKDIEDLLEVKIIEPVHGGESLEKYRIIKDDQEAMLRFYYGDYYGNRFLREGLALRYLEVQSLSFSAPTIVEEWPEYNARAIEWINLESLQSDIDIEIILSELSQLTDYSCPFLIEQDLKQHLHNTESLHQAYRQPFLERVDDIIPLIDFRDQSHSLVHGDFHSGNLGTAEGKIILYDWEYASMGSPSYDRAYYSIMSQSEFPDNPNPWNALATAVITHWYLQENSFSPKLAIYWFDQLDKIRNQISL